MDKQQTKRAKKKRGGEKTIRFRCDYASTPLKVLESRGWTRVFDPKDRRWDLWWCDTSEIKAALDCNFQRLRGQQRVAHFLNHGELTRKNLLYRNLRRYKRTLLKAGKGREAALCDIMPVSFELPSEYRMLVEEYRRSHGATWIVKPAAGSQGRGIFLFRRLRDLAEWRSREYPPPGADSGSPEPECPAPPDIYIVQKYIDDPYLLGGCKFDLRIYVLVTSFQPLKVWLAREGFARLSGEQFSLERIDDSRVHLTNMAIQLKASAGQSPPAASPRSRSQSRCGQPPARLGSKWPLSCLRQYLTERHGPELVDDLLHNIAVTRRTEKALGTVAKGSIKENESNGTNGANEESSEESSVQRPQDAAVERPAEVQNVTKTLRVGWLNKAAGATKHRKVARPRGGVKKLKLDTSAFYSAHQIKIMAAEAFGASNGDEPAILDEYAVSLGDFGGREIGEFRRRDGRLCDVWEYCRDRGKTLYQLNLFLLTSPLHEDEPAEAPPGGRTISTRRTKARARVVNAVRVFYQYTRRSSYSNELSYVEYERPELHGRVLEERFGQGPPLEHFEPPEHGYAIRRIEQAGQLLLEVSVDDAAAVESIDFPAWPGLEAHGVARDVDRLQGYCDGGFGLGFVPSCGSACRPLFSWYRDGALFKRAEYLYWLNNVKDERPHRWSCAVVCRETNRRLKSKEVLIDALED